MFSANNKFFNTAALIIICILMSACSDKDAEENIKEDTSNTSFEADTRSLEDTNTFDTDIFTITLGSDWIYDNDASEAVSESSGITCYYFYHPEDGADSDSFNEHLTISVEDLSDTGKDFSTFKDLITEQMKSDAYTVNSAESTVINGYDAWKVKYDSAAGDTVMKNYLVALNVENTICSFTFTCGPEAYDSHLSLVDQLISSAIFK